MSLQQKKEELLRKHKAERKELRKQCNEALNGTKGEERQAAEAKNDQLREDQKARHEEELAKLMESLTVDAEGKEGSSEEQKLAAMGGGTLKSRVTKAQKRREKKKAQEEIREQEKAEAKKNAGPSAKDIETEKIAKKLLGKNLVIKDISSDGHCMYRAIADQLAQHGNSSLASSKAPHMLLRSMCVSYMKENRHMFEPFMILENGETFESYCTKMRNTSAWGGQLELRALANALQQSIAVVNADTEDVVMGEEFMSNPEDLIRLTFHRHYLALGEHYNSTEPAST
mmetsp:Transcript_1010/g.1081  ORF Transcript_1010/g.1081 Transcript_1010/m.1081 type:complete len:286 (-) Transcript_1010:248-1105(-)